MNQDLTGNQFPPPGFQPEGPVTIGGGEGGGNITVDAIPTQNSGNPVASGGVFDALEEKEDAIAAQATNPTDYVWVGNKTWRNLLSWVQQLLDEYGPDVTWDDISGKPPGLITEEADPTVPAFVKSITQAQKDALEWFRAKFPRTQITPGDVFVVGADGDSVSTRSLGEMLTQYFPALSTIMTGIVAAPTGINATQSGSDVLVEWNDLERRAGYYQIEIRYRDAVDYSDWGLVNQPESDILTHLLPAVNIPNGTTRVSARVRYISTENVFSAWVATEIIYSGAPIVATTTYTPLLSEGRWYGEQVAIVYTVLPEEGRWYGENPVGTPVNILGRDMIWISDEGDFNSTTLTLVNGRCKNSMDNWKTLGGNLVTVTMRWPDTELTEGVLSINRQKSILNYARTKGMKVAVRVDLGLSSLDSLSEASHIFSITNDSVRRSNGAVVPTTGPGSSFRTFMTFASPKIANVERYLGLVANALEEYLDVIEFISPDIEGNEEFGYDILYGTDYHPLEEAAWVAWQVAQYGSSLGAQPGDFSGAIGRRWLEFKTHRLNQFAKMCGGIFKAVNPNFVMVLDSGSWHDSIALRGVWGIPAGGSKPEIDALKDNPANDSSYPIDFDAMVLRAFNPNYSVMEHTVNPGQSIATNIGRLANDVTTAKKAGTSICVYSFAKDIDTVGSFGYQVMQGMIQELTNRGWWNNTQVISQSAQTVTISVNNARTNGGLSAAYISEFNSKKALLGDGNGSAGYPTIIVINDLPDNS